jgi:DNA-binding transcriptional LysR family regulator
MALLENIRVFVRVVEQGSFSAAGRQLRLSPAVVSHRILQLENHLGARLFNRTTRQVQTTEQGKSFYERCLDVVSALDRAESSVAANGGTPKGNLRVTAPLVFGRRVLAPLVPRFREQWPQLEVRLRLSDHLVDLLGEAVDVAIRLAVLEDSSFILRKIVDCQRLLFAAPAYLDARGKPERPQDLADHDCLLLRFPGSRQFQWTLHGPEGRIKLPINGPFDADDGEVLTQWALAGQGIVMKPLWEVADHVRSGALVPILPNHRPEPATLAILYPHREHLPAKVRSFVDFAVEHCRTALAKETDGLDL